MPFSFVDIEKEKSRVISLLFFCLIVFYFVTAYLLLIVIENSFSFELSYRVGGYRFFLPPNNHLLATLIVAFTAASMHWSISTSNLIEKLTLAAGASPIDPDDTYHQYFKNIVEEVSVAIGGRKIEPWVIRSPSANAFALEDFDGRALIGITEGLLARLNRAQIEAVVGHEAGHIASGDCLSTTVSCALSEIYQESLKGVQAGLRNARGRGAVFLVLIYLVLNLMQFLSSLLRCFISRERELRADAIGVRLTRDPLSLAEALKLITWHWRGEGAEGENLQSIFIMNPRYDELDESEGFIPDLFSTHPPLKTRLDILLSLAHLDEEALEENLEHFKRVSPVAKPEFIPEEALAQTQWEVYKDDKWQGPFSLGGLKAVEGFIPSDWVKPVGQKQVYHAYERPELLALFEKNAGRQTEGACPHCKVSLQEYHYEGVLVLRCVYCGGVLVEEHKVTRILVREDYVPSDRIAHLTEAVFKTKNRWIRQDVDPKSLWVINCPKCGHKMRRQFFIYSYPIEIDRCPGCSAVWFDKDELEVLQCIYQKKDKFLYTSGNF